MSGNTITSGTEEATETLNQILDATITLIYKSLSYQKLSPQLRECQQHLLNIICSFTGYMAREFDIPFEDCAMVLFVLAFGYECQPKQWYECSCWKKVF